MASFQLFAQHGPGHFGNTSLAAKERKTRDYSLQEWEVMGNRGGEKDRGQLVQRF